MKMEAHAHVMRTLQKQILSRNMVSFWQDSVEDPNWKVTFHAESEQTYDTPDVRVETVASASFAIPEQAYYKIKTAADTSDDDGNSEELFPDILPQLVITKRTDKRKTLSVFDDC